MWFLRFQLLQECPEESVTILTASNMVKATSNWEKRGRVLESFDVEEKDANRIFSAYKNVRLIPAFVTRLDAEKKVWRNVKSHVQTHGAI